jgi:ribosomal protein S27AE
MSADNWAECPRCARREMARLTALAAEVEAGLGVDRWRCVRCGYTLPKMVTGNRFFCRGRMLDGDA